MNPIIVDKESFTELVVHLAKMSDSILEISQCLTVINLTFEAAGVPAGSSWDQLIISLGAMNSEIGYIEKLLRAILTASEPPSPEEPKVN